MSEFLAEASVLISPDLTAFREKLIAELTVATRALPPIAPRLQTADKAGSAARLAALTAEEGRLQRVGQAEQRLSVARLGASRVSRTIATAETALAAARKVDIGAATGVAEVQLRATAAKAAAAQATRTLAIVEKLGTAGEIAYAESIVAKTTALRADTVEELRNAKATQASGAARAFATRGAAAQALAFGGLRGAVLAANPAFLAGTVAAVAFAKAIGSAASLESDLAVFRVTAGATADEMERVSQTATALGADLTLPAVTAGDAAQAMTELAKAGLSVNDSIAGARGVLQLATAAQISNAEATELAANALNAYGLAGDQAVHVADVLANAANAAQGSIVDFGQALAQSSAVARQVGLSLEDTTAILTLFARNGLRGSDAGTALRTSLIRLIAPTDKAAGIIDDLGLRIRDLNGDLRPDIFAQFGKATADFSPAMRDAAAAMIFGQDALRAVAIGAREGTQGLREAQNEIAQTGTAAEVAGARMEGLSGAGRALGSNLQTMGTQIGSTLLPALTGLTRGLASIAQGLNAGGAAVSNFFEAIGGSTAIQEDLSRIERFFSFVNRIQISPAFGAGPTELFSLAPDAPQSLEEFTVALDKLGITAQDKSRVIAEFFRGSIDQAKEFKQSLSAQGLSTEGIDKVIERLRAQREAVQLGIEFDPEAEILTPLELALTRAQKLKEAFGASGIPTGPINRSIAEIQAGLDALTRVRPLRESGLAPVVQADLARVKTLLQQARSDAEHLSPTDPLAPAARKGIQAVVEELRKLGPVGAVALKEAGGLLQQAFKVNVTDGLIAAAQLGVSEAATAGASAQIGALRQLEASQQRAIARARSLLQAAGGEAAVRGGKKLAVTRAGELQQAIDDANSTRDRIRGIQDQVVADAKSDAAETERKANEARDAREKADRAFLGSLTPRRAAIDRQIQRAEGTPGLQDNVNAARALKRRLLREIEIIRESNIDTKAKAEEIQRRATELIGVGQNLTKARDDLKEARRKIAEDRAAARTSLLEARLGLAEARGDKGAQVRAIDILIADVNKRIRATKKATLAFVELQTEKQNLINKRKELLEQDEEAAKDKGTTAFDLLQQAAATFNASAGNLIGGAQPFAGPTGFTADIAQFLRRQQAPGLATIKLTGKATDDTLVSSNTQLIKAIVDLTNTITNQKGNVSTAGVKPVAGGTGERANFYDSVQSRKVVEGRIGP